MPNLSVSLASDPKAVSRFEGRRAAPSTRTSAEWERVAPALREKCFFSARVNDAEVLGKMRELIGKAVDSSKRNPNEALVSQDKFISEMKSFLRSRGYTMGGSKLTDITSRRRLGLIYDMNIQEAREYARYVRGQDADALDMYPAQEFLRVESRRVPRTDWPARWRAAGGKIRGGRMVALKSDSVWTNLSRFGRPYPPFDYGSGMGVEDVDREEAIELGLLPADEPSDEIPDFDIRLEAEVSLDRIPEDMLDSIIKETPNARIEGGKLKMSDKKPLPTWRDTGLESARNWKPSVRETTISKTEAEKKLKDGFAVSDPTGNAAVFSDDTIHWRKSLTEKDAADAFGRLIRLPMAEMCVSRSKEIWQLPNGMRNYVLDYTNRNGKHKGIATSVYPDGGVHTYFIEDINGLNLFRKGECIYRKKDGD